LRLKTPIVLVSGLGLTMLTITLASTAILKPEASVWQQVKDSLEVQNVVTQHLNLSENFTYERSLQAATVRLLNSRYAVYRFQSRATCGRWGCLHVVIDNLLQRQKAFHLTIPSSPTEYLLIENDCVVAVQTNRLKLTQKYSLCLKLK
jgi:hypothetical protein